MPFSDDIFDDTSHFDMSFVKVAWACSDENPFKDMDLSHIIKNVVPQAMEKSDTRALGYVCERLLSHPALIHEHQNTLHSLICDAATAKKPYLITQIRQLAISHQFDEKEVLSPSWCTNYDTPVAKAARLGCIEVVAALLHPDNRKNQTRAMVCAMENDHLDIVIMLSSQGIDVTNISLAVPVMVKKKDPFLFDLIMPHFNPWKEISSVPGITAKTDDKNITSLSWSGDKDRAAAEISPLLVEAVDLWWAKARQHHPHLNDRPECLMLERLLAQPWALTHADLYKSHLSRSDLVENIQSALGQKTARTPKSTRM